MPLHLSRTIRIYSITDIPGLMNGFFSGDHCSDMSIAKKSLLADVANMHKTREDADFTLVCQGEAVLVHSQILMARSPFFKAALTVDMKEKEEMKMVIEECQMEVLKKVIDFIYGLEFQATLKEAMGLAKCAGLFMMDDLGVMVNKIIMRKISSIEEAMELFEFAQKSLNVKLEGMVIYNLRGMLKQDNYIKISKFAESCNSDKLVEICAEFVVDNVSVVQWEEIEKMSMMTIQIAKKSMKKMKDMEAKSLQRLQKLKNIDQHCSASSHTILAGKVDQELGPSWKL